MHCVPIGLLSLVQGYPRVLSHVFDIFLYITFFRLFIDANIPL